MNPKVQHFFDPATSTFTYVVFDEQSKHGVIIDPVLDFDMASGAIAMKSVELLCQFITREQLKIDWILETHAHADHLTSAKILADKFDAKIAIGKGIGQVQKTFKSVFNLDDSFATDGSQFSRCLNDGDKLQVGELCIEVMSTPGHTNDSVTYLIGDAAFIGDTMFHPEVGTARCDFPGGDAAMLYQSIMRILSLPESTKLYLCHDYPEAGREPQYQVSIPAQREHNIHVGHGNSEAEFIRFRSKRDSQLAVPKLLYPSIQVNIAAGHLPNKENSGQSFIKIPLSFTTQE